MEEKKGKRTHMTRLFNLMTNIWGSHENNVDHVIDFKI